MVLRRLALSAFSACLLFGAAPLLAQSVPLVAPPPPPPDGVQGVADEPYTASFVTTRHHTLADGTEITRISKTVRYRDSLGRTRLEFYPNTSADNADSAEPIMVSITDPVANRIIHLNPRQKTATVSVPHTISSALVSPPPQPTEGSRTTATFSSLGSGDSVTAARPTIEDLGHQTIDGIDAKGRRLTRIIPAGAEGNDREITIVSETWDSPELRLVIQSHTSDPRTGETTTEMRDFSRDEPDPALFQIPPDYTVQQQD